METQETAIQLLEAISSNAVQETKEEIGLEGDIVSIAIEKANQAYDALDKKINFPNLADHIVKEYLIPGMVHVFVAEIKIFIDKNEVKE